MKTRNHLMNLDLLLVTLLGFMTWHIQMGSVIPLSFVLLRLFTTFSLSDRKKSTWLPLTICSAWMMLTFFTENSRMMETVYMAPVYKIVRSASLLLGGTELKWIKTATDLSFDTVEQSVVLAFTFVLTIFNIAWLLLYPVIEYLMQWKKKEFVCSNESNNNIFFIVAYFLLTIVLAHIINVGPRGQSIGVLNIIFFFLSGLPILLYFKGVKAVSKHFKFYSALTGIFICAYVLGCEMEHYSSLVGLVILPPLLYHLICKDNKIEMQYKDWILFIFAGISFGVAQFGCLWVRMLLLMASVLIYGYATYMFMIQTQRTKKYSMVLFLTLGFILPTLILGYNQYTVLDSRRLIKYEQYHYAASGVLITYNPATNTCGLRDRYGEILSSEYNEFVHMEEMRKPFVKIRQGNYWGIFDIEKNKIVVEPKFTDIIPHGKNTYKLLLDNDTCTYFHIKPYYYSGYDDEELWKISDNSNIELPNACF